MTNDLDLDETPDADMKPERPWPPEVRDLAYNLHGGVDLEYNHPEYGWIPFSAHPDDVEELGRDLYEFAANSGLPIADAPEPPTPPLTHLTRRQLRLGLLANGITTEDVEGAIAAIPDAMDRAVAEIEWADALIYERDHPLIEQVGTALGLTPEQIDTMWLGASKL